MGVGASMLRVAELRSLLREHTSRLHGALDRRLAPLAFGDLYGDFLSIQHAARQPIEAWFDSQGSTHIPPRQTDLIAADLGEMGIKTPPPGPSFAPSDLAEALGIAWVLAGSSLGNRVILRARFEFDGAIATRFLGDEAMSHFWSQLRPRLERSADEFETRQALKGARRTFEHFLVVAGSCRRKLAA